VKLAPPTYPQAVAELAHEFEIGTSFEVEFVESIGRVRKGLLAQLWSVPFERVRPVRSFPSFPGQKSFPGLYYAATMDAHVGFESWAERDVAMMLDFDPDVIAFSSQPFWLTWLQGGEERRHAPDYFARLADGTGVVIDVRSDDQVEPPDAEAFAATGRACRKVGWLYLGRSVEFRGRRADKEPLWSMMELQALAGWDAAQLAQEWRVGRRAAEIRIRNLR
jgi:hypothetical protein